MQDEVASAGRRDEEGMDSGRTSRDASPASHREAGSWRDLIEPNLGFVVRVALEYRDSGVPLEDLLSQGNIGLIEAARRFDPARDNTFITYAVWWIRKAMRDLIDRSSVIRIPVYHRRQLQRIQEAQAELHQRLRRRPTVTEISEKLRHPAARVWKLLDARVREVSLDEPIGRERQDRLSDRVPDRDAVNAEDRLLRNESTDALRAALAELSPLERTVLRGRFGLGGEEKTLKEIGGEVGLCRERIRQIERAATRKLRRRLLEATWAALAQRAHPGPRAGCRPLAREGAARTFPG